MPGAWGSMPDLATFLDRARNLLLALPRAATKRLSTPNWLAFIGVGFVFFAVAADHPAAKELLVRWRVLPEAHDTESAVFNWHVLVSLSNEIGFALLIAWGVAAGIEKQAREREEDNQQRARDRIASDVIHAVYGLQHDADYVKTVIDKTLQSKIVRQQMDLDYTVEPLTKDEEQALGVEQGRFVKMTMISRYAFKNVSKQAEEFTVKYGIAARFGPKIREFARIKQIRLDNVAVPESDVIDSEKTKPEDAYKSYEFERIIQAEALLHVLVEAVSIKELSDNEVWGSYHPTVKGVNFVAHVRIPGARFGVRHLTASPANMIYKTASGDGAWRIDGPILPNDSLVLWWRVPEDDGEAAQAEDVEPPPSATPLTVG